MSTIESGAFSITVHVREVGASDDRHWETEITARNRRTGHSFRRVSTGRGTEMVSLMASDGSMLLHDSWPRDPTDPQGRSKQASKVCAEHVGLTPESAMQLWCLHAQF